MRSKSIIAVILTFIFMAGPVWAQSCSADKMQRLASCVLKSLEKNPTVSGSFTQWYSVQNECDYEVDVVIQFSTGAEIAVTLPPKGGKDGASLPEGVEVTGFYCCSDSPTCETSREARVF